MAYLAMLTGRSPPPEEGRSARSRSSDTSIGRPPLAMAIFGRCASIDDPRPVVWRPSTTAIARPSIGSTAASSPKGCRFSSTLRPAAAGPLPTFRELLLEADRQGVRRSYLASEDDFQFVKRLHAKDRIVPIVGDLSGTAALAAVARLCPGAT